jgi:uncharacterized protein HemY
MHEIFRRRGTTSSIGRILEREERLLTAVDERVESGSETHGRIEAMITACRIEAARSPEDASWRLYLGRFMMTTGDPIEARDELEAAALLDPYDPRIHTHLALWYEAALLARRGERANIDLPQLAGPSLCADASRFANLDEHLPSATLMALAAEWFKAALRLKLSREDMRYLQRHLDRTQALPSAVAPPERAQRTTRSA